MVLFNQTAEYAFRAMATLAGLGPAESIRASDLSEATGVPQHYLSKIMRRLVVAGLVDARKGHGGGFRLNKSASSIRYLDVLRACDVLPAHRRCAFGWPKCQDSNPCPLHESWRTLLDSVEAWAETTTLADLRVHLDL